MLSDSQLKAKEVNGVGEMQHGAPAYSQPKALEVNGDGELQLEAQAVPNLQPKAMEVKQITVEARTDVRVASPRWVDSAGRRPSEAAYCGGKDAVPEDLVHTIVKSNCEALSCDLMEPILRDEGLHTCVVHSIGGTVQEKEPENTVHIIAKFYGEALPCNLMEPIS